MIISLSVPMHVSPTIRYNGHSYIHPLWNPWDDFFVKPFSSVLTIMQDIAMYMYMYVHWYMQVLLANEHGGTVGFAPG